VRRPIRRAPKPVRVVIVRHGPAEPRDPARWPNDDRRPLTSKGRSQTRRAARGLAQIVSPADRLVTSAAERATTTAELVAGAFPTPPKVETWPELAPGNLPDPIFARLRRSAHPGEEVVLVGHEPTLAEFVGMALVGDGISVVRLTRGGAACLDFPSGVTPGAGRLVWLFTRKQLARRDA
jgi:phosphohistidine phosphatase SixA